METADDDDEGGLDHREWLAKVRLLEARIEDIQSKIPTLSANTEMSPFVEALESLETSVKQLVDLKNVLARRIVDAPESQNGSLSRAASRERDDRNGHSKAKSSLTLDEYKRYGRQMILPQLSLKGQLRIKSASILIVGLGGLGCPAAAYLAGAGIGTIGLMDGDIVEMSNLHRQILHRTSRIGQYKVDSANKDLSSLNPFVKLVPHRFHVTPQNALQTFAQYNIILDCTDHPTSRYLISDAAVILGKPVVSASALRTDGQLIVLNYPPRQPDRLSEDDLTIGGPCYRCIYPIPPPPESLVSCGEGGILGPVVGVMGVLQALEALKIVVQDPDLALAPNPKTSLLIFSGLDSQQFRSVKMRGRRKDCQACSSQRTITENSLTSGSFDYVQFCGLLKPIKILDASERISAEEYHNIRESRPSILIDVREKAEFDICNLPNSINVPISQVLEWKDNTNPDVLFDIGNPASTPIYVICRLGNDSQIAVKRLKELRVDREGPRFVGDIEGGFRAWRQEVDSLWPDY